MYETDTTPDEIREMLQLTTGLGRFQRVLYYFLSTFFKSTEYFFSDIITDWEKWPINIKMKITWALKIKVLMLVIKALRLMDSRLHS